MIKIFGINNFVQTITKQVAKYIDRNMSELKIAQVNWTSDIIEVIPNGSFTLIKIETDTENRKGCNRVRLLRWTDAYS